MKFKFLQRAAFLLVLISLTFSLFSCGDIEEVTGDGDAPYADSNLPVMIIKDAQYLYVEPDVKGISYGTPSGVTSPDGVMIFPIAYSADVNEFGVDNVELTLYFGINFWNNTPSTVYVGFLSLGEKDIDHPYRTETNFTRENYNCSQSSFQSTTEFSVYEFNHSEKIVIPAELFQDEYGEILIYVTDDPLDKASRSVSLFYHKDNGRVTLYNSPIKTLEYKIERGDDGKYVKTTLRENEIGEFTKTLAKRLDNGTYLLFDQTPVGFCGYTTERRVFPASKVSLTFCYAVNAPNIDEELSNDFTLPDSAELYFKNPNSDGSEHLIKRIDELDPDKYGAKLLPSSYQYGALNVLYKHWETITVPEKLFIGDSGVIIFEVRELNCSVPIYYARIGDEITICASPLG